MVDSTHPVDRSADVVCPWCSAAVTADTAICPSCKAILISEQEHDLPGVTAIDAAVTRGERRPPPPRGRFLSWFSGERADQPATETEMQAIAPPDEDVQREILRLQLEAQISNLQAEADSILSDALVEGRVADLPEGLRPLAAAEADAETPAETADEMVELAMATEADETEATGEADETEATGETETAAAEADVEADPADPDQPA